MIDESQERVVTPTEQSTEATTYPIGRTSATEREAITSDRFTFWLSDDVIVNPFDIMTVEQMNQHDQAPSRTFGLVTALEHRTDAPNHLANYISSNFGLLDEEPNTTRQGTTVASANVLSNTVDIYMPVPSERLVYFAQPEDIQQALGTDLLLKERKHDAIPAGLIKMSNGAAAVAYLDRQYVLGPESAHVNVSGISGLATKTSYAMFLLQSILQTAQDKENISVIILNVKQADLLQINVRGPELSSHQRAIWEATGLEPKPFDKVRYLLPRNERGQSNSYSPVPQAHTLYAYDLEGTADKIDLLFSNVADTSGTIEGIYGEIMTGIIAGEAEFKNVQSWESLLQFLAEKQQGSGRWRGMFAGSSIGMFRRHMRRIVQTRQTGIFVNSRSRTEKLLSDELTNIRGGTTYVVDIAKLADDEQTLVFGDILRTIYAVKSEAIENRTEQSPVPEKVIIFVDELNKYAPSGSKESPITQQVLDVAERGRSLGVILISAQQFMSAVHHRVPGNSATKIIGRTGSSEVNAPDYRFLDQDIRTAVTRLAKGELLISHAIYRQPVKVIFPKPAYKQDQS
ncbi:MAG TPA: ATP-binding protein [Ktedonobacteraceae bacterium]|nr:ATP-binding protein [Ktedonobacteraceae bacterium]